MRWQVYLMDGSDTEDDALEGIYDTAEEAFDAGRAIIYLDWERYGLGSDAVKWIDMLMVKPIREVRS